MIEAYITDVHDEMILKIEFSFRLLQNEQEILVVLYTKDLNSFGYTLA